MCYISQFHVEYVSFIICHLVLQPDSPAELGNKIYEMMAMALGGRWGRLEEENAEAAEPDASASSSEAVETEVVEPSEVRTESDPWNE